jgi:hypothetical protein
MGTAAPYQSTRNSISLVVLVMEGTRSIEYMGGIILSVRRRDPRAREGGAFTFCIRTPARRRGSTMNAESLASFGVPPPLHVEKRTHESCIQLRAGPPPAPPPPTLRAMCRS